MKQGCGISLGNWIAIGVLILGIMGFVHQQISSTKEEINSNIDKVDEKVTDLSGKLDNHIQFHLNNKLCQPYNKLLGGFTDVKKSRASEEVFETRSESPR